MEVDLYRNLPANFTLHTARMLLEDANPASIIRMVDEFSLRAAYDIKTTKPTLVIYGCANAGILRGTKFDDELCDLISGVTNSPTLSAFKAIKEGLHKQNIRRLVVVTPYQTGTNQKIKKSLEENGFEIIDIQGFGISNNFEIASISEEEIYNFSIHSVGEKQPDGLLLACTNFRAMDTLKKLQEHLSFPIFCSNQLVLNQTLKLLDELLT